MPPASSDLIFDHRHNAADGACSSGRATTRLSPSAVAVGVIEMTEAIDEDDLPVKQAGVSVAA